MKRANMRCRALNVLGFHALLVMALAGPATAQPGDVTIEAMAGTAYSLENGWINSYESVSLGQGFGLELWRGVGNLPAVGAREFALKLLAYHGAPASAPEPLRSYQAGAGMGLETARNQAITAVWARLFDRPINGRTTITRLDDGTIQKEFSPGWIILIGYSIGF